MTFLFITLFALLAGALIGAIGIGGVILVPLLTVSLGIDLHVAMAASSFSFLFPGLMGTLTYAQRGSIQWQKVGWLTLGIIPAALLGARTNTSLNTDLLVVIVAGLLTFSGINGLRNRPKPTGPAMGLSSPALILIGAVVGFGSSLTGTGGPVLLVPLLLALGQEPLPTIGVSQAIQLPIALFAVAGFWLYGQIDSGLGLHLGIVQATGAYAGARLAHRLPVVQLRRLVAAALICASLLMVGQIVGQG